MSINRGMDTEELGNFLGGSMIETSSNVECVHLIPDQGTKIPHASQPKTQNINNRSNIVTNSIVLKKQLHICSHHGIIIIIILKVIYKGK